MKKILLISFLAAFVTPAIHTSKTVKDKNNIDERKHHPDVTFMSNCLMAMGAINTSFLIGLRIGIVGSCTPEQIQRSGLKEQLKTVDKFLGYSNGMFIAGLIGYYIGKKYYPSQNSSITLKNLFSRTVLAKKIYNI